MRFLTGRLRPLSAARLALLVVSTACLAACNHDDDNSTPADPNATYTVNGTVSGLDGQATLRYGAGQIVTVSADGRFSLAGSYHAGEQVNLSLTDQPFTQRCRLSTTTLTVSASANNVTLSCADHGVLTGVVRNYYTGAPIADAVVTVSTLVDGQPLSVGNVSTNASGEYRLSGLGVAARFVISTRATGFGEQATTFANTESAPDASVQSLLVQPAQLAPQIDPAQVNDVASNGVRVLSLPADSLRRPDGSAPQGQVTATVTIIDPSSDPQLMPGNYETVDAATGDTRLLESFGALSVVITDATGAELQPANGAATIRIPVASEAVTAGNLPATMPLFYFDRVRGRWVEEGQASLQQENGVPVYVGSVNHFTVWNADRVYETVHVTGCVADPQGQRLAGARVASEGQDYIGSSTTITDTNGEFRLPVRQSSSVLVSAQSGSNSNTRVVATGTTDQTLTPCLTLSPAAATIKLTWGANPHDLDSHFYGPANTSGAEFHVYYGDRQETVNGSTISLDVDDTSGYGPEIITIPSFPNPGTYRYYVRLFSGSSTIPASPARVEVNLNGEVTVFSPAQASGTVTADWAVLKFDVDSELRPTLVGVQQFVSSQNVAPASVRSTSGKHPADTAVKAKYYR